jgi:hypothetical protein
MALSAVGLGKQVRAPRTMMLVGLLVSLAFLAIVATRNYQADRGFFEGGSIADIVDTYSKSLRSDTRSHTMRDARRDLAYRLDAHVFLAWTLRGQNDAEPLWGLGAVQNLLYVIPTAFWDRKAETTGGIYLETLVVGRYGLPDLDYTPTLLEEFVADFGWWGGLIAALLLGVAVRALDGFVRQASRRVRILTLVFLGQGLLFAEAGFLGAVLAFRGLLVAFIVEYVWVRLASLTRRFGHVRVSERG